VFIGHQVIVAGLSRIEASELVEAYHRLVQAHWNASKGYFVL
jgi:hypothetical protein